MIKAKIKRKTKGQGLQGVRAQISFAVRQGVEAAARDTARLAVQFAPGPVKSAIRVELIDMNSKDVIAARVFNDTKVVPWSSYTEFGTGLYVDNEGINDAIRLKRAKRIPWYIHVSMVPESFARYGYPLVTGQNGEQYWEVDGMKPHPYMMPAAFQNRDRNVQAVLQSIQEMVRSVTG